MVCSERVIGKTKSIDRVLSLLQQCDDKVEVYYAELVALATRDFIRSIRSMEKAVVPETSRHEMVERLAERKEAMIAVVLDQMFKTFAGILERELSAHPIEFHEILGRGLERPVKISGRVYQQPARDDYDILKLLEEMAGRYRLVIFFTGDKRLAAQARTVPGVSVEYLPPGEVSGKEMAIRYMRRRIEEIIRSGSS